MAKRMVSGPTRSFLSEIVRIRKAFRGIFNSRLPKTAWLKAMQELYWENAVLVLGKPKRVIRGSRQIAEFWWDFKHQQKILSLLSIQLKKEIGPLPVHLIEVVTKEQYHIYDMVAYDFSAYTFRGSESKIDIVDMYRHRLTCKTALANQILYC
jgi:hypothetical protein